MSVPALASVPVPVPAPSTAVTTITTSTTATPTKTRTKTKPQHTLTQEEREAITAALFRREDNLAIARTHQISERSVRRIAHNLRTFGTVNTPRTKKMGRPTCLNAEIEADLRKYVEERPLALLEDMQAHIQTTHGVSCSRASLSRRMKEMGFTRALIRRGFRSDDVSEIRLGEADVQRLINANASAGVAGQEFVGSGEEGGVLVQDLFGGMPGGNGNSKKAKYAWLVDGEVVSKKEKERERKRRGMAGSKTPAKKSDEPQPARNVEEDPSAVMDAATVDRYEPISQYSMAEARPQDHENAIRHPQHPQHPHPHPHDGFAYPRSFVPYPDPIVSGEMYHHVPQPSQLAAP